MKLKLNDDSNVLNSSSLSPFPHPRVRSHNPSPTFLSFLSIRDPLLIKPNEKAQTPHLFIPSTPSLSKSNSDVSLNKLQNESLVYIFLFAFDSLILTSYYSGYRDTVYADKDVQCLKVIENLKSKGFIPADLVDNEVNWFYSSLGIDDTLV